MIARARDGERRRLPCRGVVGRGPRAEVRVVHGAVSSEHARFTWRGDRWWVRDLGSKNGTWLNGRRLAAGDDQALSVQDRIRFGTADEDWIFAEDRTPEACAVSLDGEVVRWAREGLIPLPDADHPTTLVFQSPSGWVVEDGEGTRGIAHGAVVQATPGWRLLLPEPGTATITATPPWGLADVEVAFEVSRDEETVHLLLCSARKDVRLAARAGWYLLLDLARRRQADRDAGFEESECGWIYVDELCRRLAWDPDRLNVEVYRARRALAAKQLHGAAAIVERRSTARQLRFGTERFVLP